jgi:hypothetical protein
MIKRIRKQVLPVIVIGLLVMITSASAGNGDHNAGHQPESSSEAGGEPEVRTATFGLG